MIRKGKIKQSLRLKLYESIIKPILLYISGIWSPTKKEEEQLDAFHRKQLRKVMHVKYPVTTRNSIVYRNSSDENTIFDNFRKQMEVVWTHTATS